MFITVVFSLSVCQLCLFYMAWPAGTNAHGQRCPLLFISRHHRTIIAGHLHRSAVAGRPPASWGPAIPDIAHRARCALGHLSAPMSVLASTHVSHHVSEYMYVEFYNGTKGTVI